MNHPNNNHNNNTRKYVRKTLFCLYLFNHSSFFAFLFIFDVFSSFCIKFHLGPSKNKSALRKKVRRNLGAANTAKVSAGNNKNKETKKCLCILDTPLTLFAHSECYCWCCLSFFLRSVEKSLQLKVFFFFRSLIFTAFFSSLRCLLSQGFYCFSFLQLTFSYFGTLSRTFFLVSFSASTSIVSLQINIRMEIHWILQWIKSRFD